MFHDVRKERPSKMSECCVSEIGKMHSAAQSGDFSAGDRSDQVELMQVP